MADRDAMIEDAKKALNTPSGLVKLPALAVLEVLTRESMLAKGLVQIVKQDYPAEAGNAETWAEEVLRDPLVVLGKPETSDVEGGPTECERCQGSGRVPDDSTIEDGGYGLAFCPTCEGSGKVQSGGPPDP